MEVKVCTTDSAEEAEAMRVDMDETGYEIVICDKAEIVSIRVENLTNGCTASGLSSWIIIGKK